MANERGSVLPLVVLVVALALVIAVGIGMIAHVAVDRAEAQAAADASALAGVVEGRSGAIDLARLNGAELVGFSASGVGIEVVIERNGVRAVAAAVLEAPPSGRPANQTGP